MRVAIAGAGAVGRSIAGELLENGHEVLLIDKNPTSISVERVPQAEWLLADACEITSLDEAALQRCNVVIAATGDDKVNLVVSLLAKTEYGVPRVVARVNNPKNEWLFNEAWGVDVAVSTPRLMSALVEEAVSVGDLVRLLRFSQGDANLVELTLPPDAALVGTRVGDVRVARGHLAGHDHPRRPGADARPRTTPWRPATSCCSWRRRTARSSWRTCCRRPGRTTGTARTAAGSVEPPAACRAPGTDAVPGRPARARPRATRWRLVSGSSPTGCGLAALALPPSPRSRRSAAGPWPGRSRSGRRRAGTAGCRSATLTQPSWVALPHQYSGKRIADLASRIRPQAQVALVYARSRPGLRVRQDRFSLKIGPSISPDQRDSAASAETT